MSEHPPAGWYDDPDQPGRQRWWDGNAWGPVAPEQQWPNPQPADQKFWTAGRVALLAIAVLALVATVVPGDDTDTDGPSDVGAWVVCKDFVEDRLRAPATARFPTMREANISGAGSTRTVRSHVDSENAFGATLRTEFVCEVRHEGDDRWRLVDITMSE